MNRPRIDNHPTEVKSISLFRADWDYLDIMCVMLNMNRSELLRKIIQDWRENRNNNEDKE